MPDKGATFTNRQKAKKKTKMEAKCLKNLCVCLRLLQHLNVACNINAATIISEANGVGLYSYIVKFEMVLYMFYNSYATILKIYFDSSLESNLVSKLNFYLCKRFPVYLIYFAEFFYILVVNSKMYP